MGGRVRKSTVEGALCLVVDGWVFCDQGDGLVGEADHVIDFSGSVSVDWLAVIEALRTHNLVWRFLYWPGHPFWGKVMSVSRSKTRMALFNGG